MSMTVRELIKELESFADKNAQVVIRDNVFEWHEDFVLDYVPPTDKTSSFLFIESLADADMDEIEHALAA